MAIADSRGKVDPSMVQFLNSRWRLPKSCQVCGTNKWNVEADLAELRFLSLAGFVLGGPVIPLIVVTCNYCGNTLLINAIKAGWIVPTAPPPGSAKTEGGA
jgi:hypothetical protein